MRKLVSLALAACLVAALGTDAGAQDAQDVPLKSKTGFYVHGFLGVALNCGSGVLAIVKDHRASTPDATVLLSGSIARKREGGRTVAAVKLEAADGGDLATLPKRHVPIQGASIDIGGTTYELVRQSCKDKSDDFCAPIPDAAEAGLEAEVGKASGIVATVRTRDPQDAYALRFTLLPDPTQNRESYAKDFAAFDACMTKLTGSAVRVER